MKTRTKRILLVVLTPICILLGLGFFRIWYGMKYGHQHCIKQTGIAFRLYASDHQGRLPFSTNGFGNALLMLADTNSGNDYLAGFVACICGPDDDGHIFKKALKDNSVVPEDQCTRVYIQGLSETDNPSICILFDRNSCRGGDHFRSPWGRRLREVCLLDGAMEIIPDENWPEFSRKQVELLVAAGFSRTNALHFYPAAK
jgi:hypothetical protein